MVNIAVLGHGTVGSGVVEVLDMNRERITARAHEEICVKYIVDLRDFSDLPYAEKFVKDFAVVENDDDVKIVVECIGGVGVAYDFVKRSLLAGKSVVTSNKELVAQKGQELLEIAKEKNLNFLFEASVGGGIPIIRPLAQCMAANEVTAIAGILNGTTNFILTKMINESMTFDDALALAQKLGYAERDPAADVDGLDACRKICILASLAFGRHIYPSQVSTEGIRKVTLEDVRYADAFGGSVKLIGMAKPREDGVLEMCVAPMFVSCACQLCHVDDVFNAILVRGNATDDVLFYGRGAGKLPTASAVVADVIDCAKHFTARKYLYWSDGDESLVCDVSEHMTPVYMRVEAADGMSGDDVAAAVCGEIAGAQLIDCVIGENERGFIIPAAPYGEQLKRKAALENKGLRVSGFMRVLDC